MSLIRFFTTAILITLLVNSTGQVFANLISYDIKGYIVTNDYPGQLYYNFSGSMIIENIPLYIDTPEWAPFPLYKFEINSFNLTAESDITPGTYFYFSSDSGLVWSQGHDEFLELWGSGDWDYWDFGLEEMQFAERYNGTVRLRANGSAEYPTIGTSTPSSEKTKYGGFANLNFTQKNDVPEPSPSGLIPLSLTGVICLLVRRTRPL